MLVAYIILILVNVFIIGLGVKLGCMLVKHEISVKATLVIAAITTAASLIPAVGLFAGVIALLICLVTIGDVDFWPESIMVTVIIKAVSIAATLLIMTNLANR